MHIADSQGLSRRNFFQQLGVSSSGYRDDKMDRPVVSDLLHDIVIKFNINAHWLLTGEGDMYVSSENISEPAPTYLKDDKEQLIATLKSLLQEKEKVIKRDEKIIEILERENNELRTRLSDAGSSQAV